MIGDAVMHFRNGTCGQKLYLLYFVKINTGGKIRSCTSGWNSESQDYSWTTRPKNLCLPIPDVYLFNPHEIHLPQSK